MSYGHPARTTTPRRIPRILVAGLLGVVAATAVALGDQSPASSPPTGASPVDVPRSERHGAPGEAGGAMPDGGNVFADGAVPDGATVFDDEIPGVGRLDSDLLGALRRAARDAAADGVEVVVDSGWRSPAYQAQLLREAIAKYGSEQEAARWVAAPDKSAHVSGDAVDVGPSAAAAWLSEHGAAYGLCQVYGNEPWHYELRRGAVARGCPAMYADPSQDPRMQP